MEINFSVKKFIQEIEKLNSTQNDKFIDFLYIILFL